MQPVCVDTHADRKLAQMADLPDIPLADLEEGMAVAAVAATGTTDGAPSSTATTPSNEQVGASGFEDVSSAVLDGAQTPSGNA